MLSKKIEVQGHRGCRARFPENTIPAIEAAELAGCDAVELDLLLTKDDVPVVYHDFSINPKICCHWDGTALTSSPLIRDLTLQQLRQFDCGKMKHLDFTEQQSIAHTRIPTLEEVLDHLGAPTEKSMRLTLEIKRDSLQPTLSASPERIAEIVLALVRKKNWLDRVSFSSFDAEILLQLRRISHEASLGFIFEEPLFASAMKTAEETKAKILYPDEALLKRSEDVQDLQNAGFRVITWTVNNPERCLELAYWGVDGIITDDPQQIIPFLQKLIPT
jgi:glycerophosphoryl diester phosphodiesterase